MQSQFGHVLRDGSSRATAKVQHLGTLTKSADEAIMPNLVVPIGVLTIAIPCDRVLLVVSDNVAGRTRHFDGSG